MKDGTVSNSECYNKLGQHKPTPAQQILRQKKKIGERAGARIETMTFCVQFYSYVGAMFMHQAIDLLFKCPCQVNCGVCNVPHDHQLYP